MTTVALTGFSRGIGRASARELQQRGCRLILIGRTSDAASSCVAELRAGGAVEEVACDLARVDQVERALASIRELGEVDVLINNAGVIERAPVVETSDASWELQLAVNLRAPFQLSRGLLPAMLARGRGRIVNVGSISSTLGSARQAAYGTAKWGLVGFTKCLAEELSGTGVMTVAVLPGSVDTRMLAGSGFEPRMTPEDVAKTLAYFALEAPLAHNGAVIEMFGV